MLEKNQQINLQTINPISMVESNCIELNANLICGTGKDNNKFNTIDIKNDTKENNIDNKDEIKKSLISYENLNINELQKRSDNNNEQNNLKENILNEIYLQKNEKEESDDIFRTSKLDRPSFQKIVKNNNSNIDTKYLNLSINKNLLKKFLLILKYLFGGLLTSSSIILLIIIVRVKITHQNLIGIIIEPIIILISVFGMFHLRNIIYKKIIFALFFWEGTYLFPLSFYVKESIKDDFVFYYDIIFKIRIILFFGQIINLIIFLACKLDL